MGDLTRIVLDTQAEMQEQFEKIDLKFGQMDTRLERMEFRMARFETSQNELLAQQAEFASKLDRALDVLDGIASRIKDDEVERAALSAQVTRQEDWLVDNAPKLGVTYTPGA